MKSKPEYIPKFPKPKFRKQKRALRNPVPTINDRCRICGRPYASLHEVFGGKNRQLSIIYDLQVRLCTEVHHLDVTINPKGELATSLRQEFQTKFEQNHSRDEFIRLFGKSYL